MLRTLPYKAPITGPGVWSGSDFSSPADYWYYLSRETLAELDRALQRIHGAAKPIFSLTVQDFPLPSFENDAEALREVFATLRYLLVGGDVLNPEHIRTVLQEALKALDRNGARAATASIDALRYPPDIADMQKRAS